jgi:heavy metal translocating P-type ATPase
MPSMLETYVAVLAGSCIAVYLVMRFGLRCEASLYNWPLYVVLACGGTPLMFGLFRKIFFGQFGADLLAGMSIAASVLLGEYLAGSIVVLMLAGGGALEQYATRRASSVLNVLSQRMPNVAHRKTDSGFVDIEQSDVAIGDIVTVFPHETCPLDGTVVEGRGSMDESYLTGEPFQISKVPGSWVLSGAVNGESALTISAGKLPMDSRYAKIMTVMLEAEQNRPRFRRIADRLGAWYTVFAIAFALAGWIIGRDPSRFLSVLVIATPCPLLISIPIVIIGAISTAARHSIIIKSPAMLERIDSCRTIIFDKTGTLTYGRPAVTDILCASGISRDENLRLAASMEQYSKHPLAAAILEAARNANLELSPAAQISETPGQGLFGIVDGRRVQITGRKNVTVELPPAAAGMECVLMVNDAYSGIFRFHDEPRHESRDFIRHLLPRHRVTKIMLLSGDREEEVNYLAEQVGITEALHGKSPEEKLEIVRREASAGPTLFLGDGINDAPAMEAATVGVAFGQSSDITAEAADAVVLEASLGRVDELIHIGRRMRAIALQCAIGGMGLSIIGMGFAAAGYLQPVVGAITQEIIDIAAILNALRMVLPSEDLKEV